jgi:hypothetical protein
MKKCRKDTVIFLFTKLFFYSQPKIMMTAITSGAT